MKPLFRLFHYTYSNYIRIKATVSTRLMSAIVCTGEILNAIVFGDTDKETLTNLRFLIYVLRTRLTLYVHGHIFCI